MKLEFTGYTIHEVMVSGKKSTFIPPIPMDTFRSAMIWNKRYGAFVKVHPNASIRSLAKEGNILAFRIPK